MADTGGLSTGEVGGIVAGALAIGAALGRAVQWLWGAVRDTGSSRSAKLDKWHEELTERERALKADIAQQMDMMRDQMAEFAHQVDKYRRAFGIVAGELFRRDSKNAALREARDILAEAFPLHLDVPEDMAATCAVIDMKTSDG
ncbi:hypothetical protein OOT33_13705 [Sphingobium sp. DEHP117]|uniref:hypothetical protein n=1 Tax=Sphingobium sp. DEHP117 TaxID=2993436 RepID=UPI0027D5EBED|nr:hypothetical protein [Sphingobium sp. DEHP117]MDQ4421478.1 hypothetical protein [Sphingobium sp. DEHP117]